MNRTEVTKTLNILKHQVTDHCAEAIETILNRPKLIYVSHPYQNIEANKTEVENIVKALASHNPENTYISPIHAFGYLYDDVPYEQGLRYCLDILASCDEMIVCGDYTKSRGCKAEIEYCKAHGIPYKIMEE